MRSNMRGNIDWEKEKDNLERLILVENRSYIAIGKIYNCTDSNIRKVAKRLGIEIKPRRVLNENEIKRLEDGEWSKSKIKYPALKCLFCGKEFRMYKGATKFCSRKCFFDYQRRTRNEMDEILIEKWLNGEIDGTIKKEFTYKPFVRKYLFRKYNNKCQKCGWGEVNKATGLVPLQIHHIDGDALNNKEENLELLCPNCHALTDNFGSRNKNATEGRSEYYGRAFKKRRDR